MRTVALLVSAFLVPLTFCAQHPAHGGQHPPAAGDPRPRQGEPPPMTREPIPMQGGEWRQGPDGPRGGNHDELRVLRDQLRETAHAMLRQADEIDKILGGPRDPGRMDGRRPRGPRQGPDRQELDRRGPGGPGSRGDGPRPAPRQALR